MNGKIVERKVSKETKQAPSPRSTWRGLGEAVRGRLIAWPAPAGRLPSLVGRWFIAVKSLEVAHQTEVASVALRLTIGIQ